MSTEADPRIRRRVTITVFVAVGLALTGMFATFTVLPLLTEDVAGSTGLSGSGPAAAVAGTAVGAAILGNISARRGRRVGLLVGFVAGATGAMLGVVAGLLESLPLLLAGMLLFGAGNSANLLSRYAVAAVHPEHRRASIVGLVVWAGTLGAVVGPPLAEPAGSVADGLGLPELTGALLLGAMGFAAAGLLCVTVPMPRDAGTSGQRVASTWATLRDAVTRPVIRVAMASIVISQVVMVLIMTMTPVFIRGHGHGLGTVGTIMSAHILGMYMLTPAIGWVVDRLGAAPVVVAGMLLIASAAVLGATADEHATLQLGAALWLLGIGWSLGFVAASGMLAHGEGPGLARLQGSVDSLVFAAATIASVASGVLMSALGYVILSVIGLGLALATALAVVVNWDAVPRPAETG